MFMGEYNHSIDPKGRLIMPAKFREELGPKFIITKGLDGCLFVYTMSDWDKIVKQLQDKPNTSREARRFSRFLIGGATECETDRQGRIHIPQTLAKYAGLEKDVVLVGLPTRIEIWNSEKWEIENTFEDINAVAENMGDVGIII